MKRKNIFMGFICLLMSFILTGCGNKTAITTNEFITISENKGYVVTDVTNQYKSYGYIKEGTVTQSKEGWQVEFYVLEDEGYATSMFNTNKTNFENSKGNSSTSSSSSMGNYSTYSLTSNGYYMHVCRVDNTLLYVRVEDTYKDTVKDFTRELGY